MFKPTRKAVLQDLLLVWGCVLFAVFGFVLIVIGLVKDSPEWVTSGATCVYAGLTFLLAVVAFADFVQRTKLSFPNIQIATIGYRHECLTVLGFTNLGGHAKDMTIQAWDIAMKGGAWNPSLGTWFGIHPRFLAANASTEAFLMDLVEDQRKHEEILKAARSAGSEFITMNGYDPYGCLVEVRYLDNANRLITTVACVQLVPPPPELQMRYATFIDQTKVNMQQKKEPS